MNISPSILDANFQNLQLEIDSIQIADKIHLDIMDGHYVPNMSFGPGVLRNIDFPIPKEVHLMVQNPENFFWMFANAGALTISFHIENTGQFKALDFLRHLQDTVGVTPGIVIDGYTDPQWLTPQILEMAGQILVMSVKSGFGGQQFMPEALKKIEWLRAQGFENEIEVDGGINLETARQVSDAGADTVVVGSFLMHRPPAERADIIRAFQAI